MKFATLTTLILISTSLAGCGSNPSASPANKVDAPQKQANNKDKILGVWEVVFSLGYDPGSTIEFAPDGKWKVATKHQGKDFHSGGTYAIEGDSLTMVEKVDGKEVPVTGANLRIRDDKLNVQFFGGKPEEYKRKK